MTIIYIIKNIKRNKVYIGQTKRNIEDRFYEHYWSRNKKCCKNRDLYKDMIIDKIDSFDYNILEFDPIDPNESEKKWINFFNSLIPFGYNVSKGGDFNLDIDESRIIKLYEQLKSINLVHKNTKYSRTTIRKVLKKNNIKRLTSIEVKRNKFSKKLKCYNDYEEYIFNNQFEAAKFLIDKKLTKMTNINNIVTAIFNGIKHKYNRLYGYIWTLLN